MSIRIATQIWLAETAAALRESVAEIAEGLMCPLTSDDAEELVHALDEVARRAANLAKQARCL